MLFSTLRFRSEIVDQYTVHKNSPFRRTRSTQDVLSGNDQTFQDSVAQQQQLSQFDVRESCFRTRARLNEARRRLKFLFDCQVFYTPPCLSNNTVLLMYSCQ